MNRNIVLIAHNLRSCHNIGSLFRTAEGLGVAHLYLTGYTPYPAHADDTRLPHEAEKINKQIAKTALGAEKELAWTHEPEITSVINNLRASDYQLVALEQAENSVALPEFKPSTNIALVLGREVEGIEPEILEQCSHIIEIPMFGKKESFNVVQAAAMALYHCRFS